MNIPARRRVARLRAGVAGRCPDRPGRGTPSRTPGAGRRPGASSARRPSGSRKREGLLESARHGEPRGRWRSRPIAGRENRGRAVPTLGEGRLRGAPGQSSEARSRVAVPAAGHSADDGDAVSFSDLSTERPRALRLRGRRARLARDLHGWTASPEGSESVLSRRLGRPLGGRHAGGRCDRLQRSDMARPGRSSSHRSPARDRALHAARTRRRCITK